MKKLGSLLLILVLMFSLSACVGAPQSSTESSTESASDLEAVTTPTENTTEVSDEERLSERLIREIDGEYKEKQELPENCTTIGMVQLADEYCKKWEQVADEYYNKLMEYDEIIQFSDAYYTSEDLHTFVSEMKENWEKYKEEDFCLYSDIVCTINGGGSAVPVITSDYVYEETMEWALKLVVFCERLNIE